MVKKKALFEAPARSKAETEAAYDAAKAEFERGYVFRKDMQFKPDVTLPWWEQVLDLERQGKPTTYIAHDLAITAQRKHVRTE